MFKDILLAVKTVLLAFYHLILGTFEAIGKFFYIGVPWIVTKTFIGIIGLFKLLFVVAIPWVFTKGIKYLFVGILMSVKWTIIGFYIGITKGFLYTFKAIYYLLVKGLPWLLTKGVVHLFVGTGLAVKYTAIGLYLMVIKGVPAVLFKAIPWVFATLLPMLFTGIAKAVKMFITLIFRGVPEVAKEIYAMFSSSIAIKIILGFAPIVIALFFLGNGYDNYLLTGILTYIALYTIGLTKIKETLYLALPALILCVGTFF